jgi:hypothetical protein
MFALAVPAGQSVTGQIEDIAFDSFVSAATPGGSLWTIDSGGNVNQFAINLGAATWTSPAQVNIQSPNPATAYFEGIALDHSRPMTLPPLTWLNNQANGTVMGLDTQALSGGVGSSQIVTLLGPNIQQEQWNVGPALRRPLGEASIGMDFSSECVRTGIPGCACPSELQTSTAIIDVQFPATLSGSTSDSLVDVNGLPGTYSVDIEDGFFTTLVPVTTYLLRNSLYFGAMYNGCLLYPAPTGVVVPVPGAPPHVTTIQSSAYGPPPGGTITLDSRAVEYIQWIYMCGSGVPFNLAFGNYKTSDAIRISWSNL